MGDRSKIIAACAALARTSWLVEDELTAESMRQRCCEARDAVDRMHARIRELEAENARLRDVGDAYALRLAREGSDAGHDFADAWERAKRGTHG